MVLWLLFFHFPGIKVQETSFAPMWQVSVNAPLSLVKGFDDQIFVLTGTGAIARISSSGSVENAVWAQGFQGARDLAYSGSAIWVAGKRDLWEVDRHGKVRQRFTGPENATWDAVAAQTDTLFLADTRKNRIYRFHGGRFHLWTRGDHLHQPAAMMVQDNQLYLACLGGPVEKGALRVLPLTEGGTTSLWSGPLGRLTGLAPDGDFGFLLSDRQGRRLLHLGEDGQVAGTISLKGKPAGVCLLSAGAVAVALPEANLVTAYALKK